MSWCVPPYDRAVAEAEAFVRATWKTHGIVVAGSIVRGEADPTSDLDIFVVHAEPWRLRDQRRFAGVPTELFVNPPDRIRGYFTSEHARGRPSTAHMFATGVVLAGADGVVGELVDEARDWMARPVDVAGGELTSKRYSAVDTLDNARDRISADAAMATLLLADAAQQIAEYAFWKRRMLLPRRKDTLRALAMIDPVAADHVRAFVDARGEQALQRVIALANHVLGVDTFFEWTSDRS
jgi:predicted nucleotidyltransferase